MVEQIVTHDDINVLAACFKIIEQFNNNDKNSLVDYIQADKAQKKFAVILAKLGNVGLALSEVEINELRRQALNLAKDFDEMAEVTENV